MERVLVLIESASLDELRPWVQNLRDAAVADGRVSVRVLPVTPLESGGFSSPPVAWIAGPRTPRQEIIAGMRKFITEDLKVQDELIIVDPYFFAPNSDTGYVGLVSDILAPFAPRLSSLSVVTHSGKKKLDQTVVSSIQTELAVKCPKLNLRTFINNSFHDRFWINPKERTGIVTGTSLNGLGQKYSLVARLSSADALDVLGALKRGRVIK